MSLAHIAQLIGGEIIGDPDFIIEGFNSLEKAQKQELSFLTNQKYRHLLSQTQAGAILLRDKIQDAHFHQIVSSNPYLALAKLIQFIFKPKLPELGIHPSAVIAPDSSFGRNCRIAAHTVIGEKCKIGDRSAIFPGVVVGQGSQIGSDCIIYPNVVIYHDVVIGSHVIIHANSVIGSDGFGYAKDGDRYFKIQQMGRTFIDDDVEIGAGCTIDRGSMGDTIISRGVKLDNLIQIAHNVTIGENTAIAAQTGISGSSKIGKRVTMAGQVGITGHVTVGDDCILTGRCGLQKNAPEKSILSGYPSMPHRQWLKKESLLTHVPEIKESLKELKQRILDLESRLKSQEER